MSCKYTWNFSAPPAHPSKKVLCRIEGYPNCGKGWGEGKFWEEMEIFLGEIFLPDGGNLSRSDYDNSNLFQS